MLVMKTADDDGIGYVDRDADNAEDTDGDIDDADDKGHEDHADGRHGDS